MKLAFLVNVLRDDRRATIVEYSIMVSLIAAVCVVIVGTLGGQVKNEFQTMVTAF